MLSRYVQEGKMILRGLACLALIVTLGLTVAEAQLNSLTERADALRLFSMKRDAQGRYILHLGQQDYSLYASIRLGKFFYNKQSLTLTFGDEQFQIPFYATVDGHKLFDIVQTEYHIGINELYQYKRKSEFFFESQQEKTKETNIGN